MSQPTMGSDYTWSVVPPAEAVHEGYQEAAAPTTRTTRSSRKTGSAASRSSTKTSSRKSTVTATSRTKRTPSASPYSANSALRKRLPSRAPGATTASSARPSPPSSSSSGWPAGCSQVEEDNEDGEGEMDDNVMNMDTTATTAAPRDSFSSPISSAACPRRASSSSAAAAAAAAAASLPSPPPGHQLLGGIPTKQSRDEFLIESKKQGLTYREIKNLGAFPEAESTLRGRYRSLTKPLQQRVRKPEWTALDLSLLEAAVYKYGSTSTSAPSSSSSTTSSSRHYNINQSAIIEPRKISWVAVAKYIVDNGGTYHYGNATCRKRWDQLCAERASAGAAAAGGAAGRGRGRKGGE